MRFAVISDVNGNLTALRAVLAAIDGQDAAVDRIVCAGDIVGRGPSPNEVIDLLRERDIEVVLGNYDDAVAFDRLGSGRDFADRAAEDADAAAIEWTRAQLTAQNLEYLRGLPRDLRLFPGGTGTSVKRNEQDARSSEYRRTFFLRAILGGAVRTPVSPYKRVLVVHGSTRALNEFVRGDTAHSILGSLAREAQTDVLITGHAASSFRRDAHNVAFIGVGPVDGPGRAEYALMDVSREVNVAFEQVPFDVPAHIKALRESGLPERIIDDAAHVVG
ncbi:MAG TPA: metallophosphoesterase family protein [Chloroflexota bacterium]